MKTEDKGKKEVFDESGLTGDKPASWIGPGRSPEEVKKVVEKVKSKRAKTSNFKDGEIANVGEVQKAIGNFVNNR